MLSSLRSLGRLAVVLRQAFGRYRRGIAALVALNLGSGLLEGVGINSLIPLLAFATKSGGAGDDAISRFISRFFSLVHWQISIRTLLIFIVVLFLGKAILSLLATRLSARLAADYERTTRVTLLEGTLRARWPYLLKQKIGYLDQLLTTDVMASASCLHYISATIAVAASLLVYTVIVINISPLAALLTVLSGAVLFYLFKPLFYRSRQNARVVSELYKDMAHLVSERLIGMKTVKALGGEGATVAEAAPLFARIRRLNISIVWIKNYTGVLLQLAGVLFVVALFSFFYKLTTFNLAAFAVAVYAINKIFAYLQLTQAQLHSLNAQLPYVSNLLRYQAEVQGEAETAAGSQPFRFANQLVFDQVNFSYAGAAGAALVDFSVAVKRGEFVGLVGPSGSGKTTVADLLLRLYEPERGALLLDGVPAGEISRGEWRRSIGYMAQEVFLLNDTIENNIRFYDASITDAALTEAVRAANLENFIRGLPQGLATIVGERGVRLSGGERQRIALARVLARAPDILALDEATSALDTESEQSIQQAILNLKGRVTVIVIAHRLSTVMSADRVLVLAQGRLAESGAPQELLNNPTSHFARLYAAATPT
ncbi:MAG: ABC transporter ATP-binding protein [Candidatus Magasanikbacteria bacterium]|nr:ABC transporter ATP-binding protein [Candidatus Magasanikbacteria bacterium]